THSLGSRTISRIGTDKHDRPGLNERDDRPRAECPLERQSSATSAWSRHAATLREARSSRALALDRDGAARLLQPRLRQRNVVRQADRPVLLVEWQALLVGRREPALVVSRRQRLECAGHVVEQPRAQEDPPDRTLAG